MHNVTSAVIMQNSQKVIVGMSGGVDSSVAAYLLLEQGYQVEGMFMKNWEEDDGTEYCTAIDDLNDAKQVCELLGIKLHLANFASEYWDNVFEYFLQEYRAYRTPNPDVLCNREIKFKVFSDYAKALGADLIATGHYVRTLHTDNQCQLLKGLDENKDQSYFLHAVPESALAKCLFPVGHLEKSKVREIAHQQGFITSRKKDSTGICFIGERRFKDFLQQYLPAQPGHIETLDGTIIGQHQGLMYYTFGQRKGLGIGGVKQAEENAWYVAEKDIARNALVVVQGEDHPSLKHSQLNVETIEWINQASTLPLTCTAKIRYRQQDQPCEVTFCDNNSGYSVKFTRPQRAVTPGQYLVLYSEERCLGGGVITHRV